MDSDWAIQSLLDVLDFQHWTKRIQCSQNSCWCSKKAAVGGKHRFSITTIRQFRRHLKTLIPGWEIVAHCDSWLTLATYLHTNHSMRSVCTQTIMQNDEIIWIKQPGGIAEFWWLGGSQFPFHLLHSTPLWTPDPLPAMPLRSALCNSFHCFNDLSDASRGHAAGKKLAPITHKSSLLGDLVCSPQPVLQKFAWTDEPNWYSIHMLQRSTFTKYVTEA